MKSSADLVKQIITHNPDLMRILKKQWQKKLPKLEIDRH